MPAKKVTQTSGKQAGSKPSKLEKTSNKKEEAVNGSPLMVAQASSSQTRTRSNRSSSIERTNRFKNIDDGLIPFNYSNSSYNKGSTNLDVKDAVVLCQKAYYNFAVFRNTIDLMTEISTDDIYLTGGSKKSREFFDAFFNKINLQSLQEKFFREYYRSGNVFIYRFDKSITKQEARKITQTFAKEKTSLPVRYIILNPADIQMGGNISFADNRYYKVLNTYEIERLKNPSTEEDYEMISTLPEETRKALQKKTLGVTLTIPLNHDKMSAVFYKRQDYEPFGVPMGYPVLEDINWKTEMKKMDMALTRTMQQMILLVTMGTEPEKGGINQKNLESMQKLFENESIGRVLIADYTTKAEFIIPKVADLLDPKKYEVVNEDIQMGLNNILVGSEKFANQTAKTEVFVARLRQARKAFINIFLLPEIKRVAKALGMKNYPIPHFEEILLQDDYNANRIYSRMVELGLLTPEEGFTAFKTGRLPTEEESLESQKEYKRLRDKGFYEPLAPSKEEAQSSPNGGGGAGRPAGTSSPQKTKKVTPIGRNNASELISLEQVKNNFILAQKLENKIHNDLRKKYNIDELNEAQLLVAQQIMDLIIVNEDPKSWNRKVKVYLDKPIDKNPERVQEVQSLAYEHQVDDYLAGILYASKKK